MILIRIGLLSTIYYLLPTVSIAQISFERTYGGVSADQGHSVQQTTDGGYIIAGQANFDQILQNSDVYLIKTDSLGDTLWTKTYRRTTVGDSLNNSGYSVQQTVPDEGYIIVGFTYSSSSGSFIDVYLIKTDSLGDTLWTKTYGGTDIDAGRSVRQTLDGGYIIAGATRSFGAGDSDVYLVKTDSLGEILWTRAFVDSSGDDGGYSVQQTIPDGGYIITGSTNIGGSNWYDVYLIKTDPSGDTLWTRTFGGSGFDQGRSVHQTSDGGYIIAGCQNCITSSADVYLIKTDSLGDTLWTRTYGGTDIDNGRSVQETQDGGYIITGRTSSFGAGFLDVYLIKTDSLGNTLWTRTFGGSDWDEGYSVQSASGGSDAGYVITGLTYSFGAGLRDVYLIKTDVNGMVGIEEGDNEKFKIKNDKFQLLQNQPNPFHKLTAISYQIPSSNPASRIPSASPSGGHHVSLSIYDITGRLVETLVNQVQESGVYQVEWEGKGQSSGVYFYRLTVGSIHELPQHTATRKLILLH
jgi:hypothetical protein